LRPSHTFWQMTVLLVCGTQVLLMLLVQQPNLKNRRDTEKPAGQVQPQDSKDCPELTMQNASFRRFPSQDAQEVQVQQLMGALSWKE
jgi:hypothetical protein